MASRDIQMETSADIMSIASRYIVVSVLIIAIGAVYTVYAILDYLVYELLHGIFLVLGGFFLGIAFIISILPASRAPFILPAPINNAQSHELLNSTFNQLIIFFQNMIYSSIVSLRLSRLFNVH